MFANVDHLHQIRVQTGLTDCPLEERFVSTMTAPSDYHPVQPVLLDSFSDLDLSFIETAVTNLDSIDYVGQRGPIADR
jgi:hypothetical protein